MLLSAVERMPPVASFITFGWRANATLRHHMVIVSRLFIHNNIAFRDCHFLIMAYFTKISSFLWSHAYYAIEARYHIYIFDRVYHHADTSKAT